MPLFLFETAKIVKNLPAPQCFRAAKKNLIKKFLEIDYPRSRAARYCANFLSFRATGISETKDKTGTPERSSGEFFR